MVCKKMKLAETKILYQDTVINNNNIDDFLNTPHGGAYHYDTNTIILYNYIISQDILDAQKAAEAKSIIHTAIKHRPSTIVHEKRHWHNRTIVPRFQDFCLMNYYQEVSLQCLDEISAITADILYTTPRYKKLGICQATVLCSMLEATERFKNSCLDEYLNRFIDWISESYHLDVELLTVEKAYVFLQQLQATYKDAPQKLFDKRFHDAVKGYFTFDNYCILNDKISPMAKEAWTLVQQNLAQIKQRCIAEVHKMINTIIKSKTFQK